MGADAVARETPGDRRFRKNNGVSYSHLFAVRTSRSSSALPSLDSLLLAASPQPTMPEAQEEVVQYDPFFLDDPNIKTGKVGPLELVDL